MTCSRIRIYKKASIGWGKDIESYLAIEFLFYKFETDRLNFARGNISGGVMLV